MKHVEEAVRAWTAYNNGAKRKATFEYERWLRVVKALNGTGRYSNPRAVSAAARKNMSLAQKARWATKHKEAE